MEVSNSKLHIITGPNMVRIVKTNKIREENLRILGRQQFVSCLHILVALFLAVRLKFQLLMQLLLELAQAIAN